MSYSYDDYMKNQTAASKAAPKQNAQQTGFFKLKDDGDEALVRFNISSTDDIIFETIHTFKRDGRFGGSIRCLNPYNKFGSSDCPLCAAAAAGNSAVSKALNRCYTQMVVAYRDKESGAFGPAMSVVWDRPAGFSKELAGLIRDYGNIKEHVFKITRNGVAGARDTTYAISYIPLYDKPELVPADFSAFDVSNKARQCGYYEKSLEDINEFLTTGSFPMTKSAATPQMQQVAPASQPVYQAPVATPMPTVEPAPASIATPQQTSSFTGSENYPTRNFDSGDTNRWQFF